MSNLTEPLGTTAAGKELPPEVVAEFFYCLPLVKYERLKSLMHTYAEAYAAARLAEVERLREFAQLVMDNWPHGDVDGGDLQEAAIRCGLLEPQTRTQPCSEGCNCTDYFDSAEWADGITCYRRTPLLKGDAAMKKSETPR
jgi:hypothetical protein